MPIFRSQDGYTLIEMVAVIVIISIISIIAMESLDHINQNSRFEETRLKMEQLTRALIGSIAGSHGYIKDNGALPGDWDDLVTNPGLGTWNGPYITEDFSDGSISGEFKTDAWGVEFTGPGVTFSSTGSGQTITKHIASDIDKLLYNRVSICVYDLDYSPPGLIYDDSLEIEITYPNGAGGLTSRIKCPDHGGLVTFDSIPIGTHRLRMIYLPDNDTLTRNITVTPGQDYYAEWQHYAELW